MDQQLRGPGYARQSIDGTTLSVSTQSDINSLRSALRRSSSSSNPPKSPRRVRFDLMGVVVLPTASPQAAGFRTPSLASAAPSAKPVSSVFKLDYGFEESPINMKPSTYTMSAKSSSDSQRGPTAADKCPLDALDAEEDDMFHFEAGGPYAPLRPQPKRPSAEEEEEEEEETRENPGDVPDIKPSLYATSGAVDITKPSLPSALTTSTMAKFQDGSLGSYKGRPVTMPVVRDPDVNAQAASLELFDTFVGGLGGDSGMSGSDLNCFRGGVFKMPLSGMPRSFMERLVMEEQIEKQRVAMFSQVTACGP